MVLPARAKPVSRVFAAIISKFCYYRRLIFALLVLFRGLYFDLNIGVASFVLYAR